MSAGMDIGSAAAYAAAGAIVAAWGGAYRVVHVPSPGGPGAWSLLEDPGSEPCRACSSASELLAYVRRIDALVAPGEADLDQVLLAHGIGGASDIKPGAISSPATNSNFPRRGRGRPLSPEVLERRRQITELAEEFAPATIRQLYYLCEVRGLVGKDDAGYRAVQHDVLILRQQGDIDYDWISDSTRWARKSRSYKGIDHFIKLSIDTYRRDLWHDADVYVEIWIEKDALAGSIMEETNPFDVPLMVAKGFSSETYLYEAAEAIADKGKPSYIYALFDRDPSGAHSAKHIERKLREFAPDAEIHFELVAVTPQQIEEWGLATRDTKREKNRHAKNFVGVSCELDSIPPDKLRGLVRECIERHIDHEQLNTLQVAERSERSALKMFARNWRGEQSK
jgi:hypothetical protein